MKSDPVHTGSRGSNCRGFKVLSRPQENFPKPQTCLDDFHSMPSDGKKPQKVVRNFPAAGLTRRKAMPCIQVIQLVGGGQTAGVSRC